MDAPVLGGPVLLENPIKHYAWGSRVALAELQGRPVPSPAPEAELWMGAHPAAPSLVALGSDRTSLERLIADAPERLLGARVGARFGRLPFLLKVLAAERPLSIQAHPDSAQARAGFEAETRLGVPLDAPQRNYKDPFHKPELLCAVTPFDALCGFRDVDDVVALARTLRIDAVVALARAARDARSPLRELFIGTLELPPERRGALVDAAVAACRQLPASVPEFARAAARWVLELAQRHPGDVGVLAPLLLNHVELEPGEALYLGASSPHAYLRGVGIEIMASSDNVLRGGLTEKHVDVAELDRVLRFESAAVQKLRADPIATGEAVYATPAPEFRLSRLELGPARSFETAGGAPEILLCWQGEVALRSGERELSLARGRAAFVPASAPGYSAAGSGVLFRATVGDSTR